jgi:hypothetical protein
MQRTLFLLLGILVGALLLQQAVPPGRAHDDPVAHGPAKAPLFINMTTGDSWRGWMGLHFAHSTLKMGHPVAVFLNLDAVKLAAKSGDQMGKPGLTQGYIFADNARTFSW